MNRIAKHFKKILKTIGWTGVLILFLEVVILVGGIIIIF